MGYTTDGKYHACSNGHDYKIIEVVEDPTGDGWRIGRRAPSGEKFTIVKKWGWFETCEEADAALNRLAVENKWTYARYWESKKFGPQVEFETASDEPEAIDPAIQAERADHAADCANYSL